MANSRKDLKGRSLRQGESWRKEGRYSYRYLDIKTGKRQYIYALDLAELREKEKQIEKDLDDSILTNSAIKKLTLNSLFEKYMSTRELAKSTKMEYFRLWNNHVNSVIGNIKVVQILPSHMKAFYTNLSQQGYAHSTIKAIHNILYPALEMAVDDDIIRKNPVKFSISDYGKLSVEREALTIAEQRNFMEFAYKHNVYNVYIPMLIIMLGTGLRCGELIGLTWSDIDLDEGIIDINHQLIYKDFGDGKGYCFHITSPKTKAGLRTIPMTKKVLNAFREVQKMNSILGKNADFQVDGYSGFVFLTKNNRPLMPNALNNILYGIKEAYDRLELRNAIEQGRETFLLPKISAHMMRHTACTRYAELGMDIKVLQYIMGHANIKVTMDVYNHISEPRVNKEMLRLEDASSNLGIQKEKWCQIGVNTIENKNFIKNSVANSFV